MTHSLSIEQLPFSQACENNKRPILNQLSLWFANTHHVVEIGSGTGQHSVYFAKHLPQVLWQPSDQASYLPTLQARLTLQASPNLQAATELDVSQIWPQFSPDVDGIYTANTLHIMSKVMVEAFFIGMGKLLAASGTVVVYGPFNYHGQFTSDSNHNFDVWLRKNNPLSGIRDIEWICQLAKQQQLVLQDDIEMPANNRLLRFIKR